MQFLLKSEVETVDIKKDYHKKKVYCPNCFKLQIKKLDSNLLFNTYQCWNKDCKAVGKPFIVLNTNIKNVDLFDGICDSCQEPYHRKFILDKDENPLLVFKCSGKLCESNMDPFVFNLGTGNWEGNSPKVILYDDESLTSNILEIDNKQIKETCNGEEREQDPNDFVPYEIQERDIGETHNGIEDIPLLTMNNTEYTNFLERHQQKVVVLVDLPNFIRTMRGLYPRNFEDVLRKAHDRLLQYIENSFHTSKDYIIRYFSKPAKDLEIPNSIIINFSRKTQIGKYSTY